MDVTQYVESIGVSVWLGFSHRSLTF